MSAGGRRSVARWIAPWSLLAALWMLLAPAAAHAHLALRRSAPAADARLDAVPRTLRLVYSEAVTLDAARILLLAPGGDTVALGPLRHGDSTKALLTDVAPLPVAGRYTVRWQIVGRDGHPVRGEYAFTVLPGAAGLAPATPADDTRLAPVPSPDTLAHDTLAHDAHAAADARDPAAFDAESAAYVLVRWLGFAALLATIGAAAFRLLVLARLPAAEGTAALRDAAGRRAATLGLVAALALVGAALLRLVAQRAALRDMPGGGDLAALLGGTTWGWGWTGQVAAALAAAAGFALARRGTRAGWALAAAAALALGFTAPLAGHAAAAARPALAVLLDGTHVLAASAWLGALLLLVAAGLPAAPRDGDARWTAVAALVRAFSPAALLCAAVVALTGALTAWLHLGALAALWGSDYGRTLLAKLALVAAVAAVGAYNWRVVQPALARAGGPARLRRTAVAELLLATLVLLATAVLVATPSP